MKKHKNLNLFMMYIIVYLIAIPKIITYVPLEIQNYLYLILAILFMVIIVYWNRRAFEKLIYKILNVCDKSIYIGVITIVLIAISIICTYAKTLLHIGNNSGYINLISQYKSNKLIFTIIIIVITPIIEEIIYKFVLFKNANFMKEKTKCKLMTCSTTFAVMHILDEIILLQPIAIIDFINYFIFGVMTTLVYKKTDNILFPLAIHMLCNGVALYLL